nr:DUF4011 domain-containing protein [Massilia glaciei]
MIEPGNAGGQAPAPRTLRSLLAAQAGMPLSTDDVLVLVLPLLRQVAALHGAGLVATLDADNVLLDDNGALGLRRPEGAPPLLDTGAVNRVQPQPLSGLNIVGTLQRGRDEHGAELVTDLALAQDADAAIERPVYLPGPDSWELRLGHHDELTDVFSLGMIVAALACGLDFTDDDDLRQFAGQRGNLFALHPELHPIVAAVLVEMTELNRHARATDAAAAATRLRTWREQPAGLDVARALAGASGAAPRRAAVLTHLRDRLFDLSRRNRLLYFRPSAASVNLTVASVPLMLQVESVRAEHICTWGGPFAAELVAGKPVSLQHWLRFEDQPYLPGALDHLITETRRDRAEFGFSNLRIVVAFLRWHNLKEAPDERIVPPLLWLGVELVKRKGVRDQYVLQCTDDEAEFNPVLRHQLSELYDIGLPEKIDLEKTTLAEIHADILAQIRRSEPSVALRLVDKAAIGLVRQKALQRMQQYQRRKAPPGPRAAAGARLPPFSYDRLDYRPLGRALFERWVRPSELPQRTEAGAPSGAGLRRPQMAAPGAAGAESESYFLQESEGHRYAWDLDLTQVTLANFNYKKMSLVRDYAQLLGDAGANPAFDRVFSIEPREVETAPAAPLKAGEQWSVVAADATHNAAVGLARSGRSFIIHGPPGTGKSQTITNLIADYAGRGKRVLFVCEKRAALDVVFSRLKQAGLAELCCLIHDSQTDKKAFIGDLKASYEQWIGQPRDSNALKLRRQQLVHGLTGHQLWIDDFEAAMAAAPRALGTSLRALLRRVAALPAAPELGPARRERLPALAKWDAQRELAERINRQMHERFGLNSLAAHPFARLSASLMADEHAYSRVAKICDEAEALLGTLDPLLDDADQLIGHQTPLARACGVAAESGRLLATGLAAHLELLDPGSPAQEALGQARAALDAHAQSLAAAQAGNASWRDKLAAADTDAALALARRLEPSVMRWLQPRWWRLRGELARRYDFGKHVVHTGYAKVLELLAAEHGAAARWPRSTRRAANTMAWATCKRSCGRWPGWRSSSNPTPPSAPWSRTCAARPTRWPPRARWPAPPTRWRSWPRCRARGWRSTPTRASTTSPNCCATCARRSTTCPTCCRCCAPCTRAIRPARQRCKRWTTVRPNSTRWWPTRRCAACCARARCWRASAAPRWPSPRARWRWAMPSC